MAPPIRNSKKCQSRRKHSLGKLRRAHPASGATWNVQVVRGKMSSKCLWHACRALILGMFLMLLGGGLATIGYYADHLSVASEVRGNTTFKVKNETKGFHLNNLSYVGPIVMGFGGFIVVAACVMTFEARDSAAKVVPARFKSTGSNSCRSNVKTSNSNSSQSQRRTGNGVLQKTRWDHHLGVFRTSPSEPPPLPPPIDRQALTAALIHFSKTMGTSPNTSPKLRRLSHTGSVPDLANSISGHNLSPSRKPFDPISIHRHNQRILRSMGGHQHQQHNSRHHHSKSRSPRRGGGSLVQRTTRESASSLLHPLALHKLHRHALSVDETGPYFKSHIDGDGSHNGSLLSVTLAMETYENRRDRTKRSDTAKRHVLSRQKPIENDEAHSDRVEYRRRSSTLSDASNSGQWVHRRTSSTSRTLSIDSRNTVQVELHSPDKFKPSPKPSQRILHSGTPSFEKEFRSQISLCSEPGIHRQHSGQSSIDPYVLEETPEAEERENSLPPLSDKLDRKIRPGTLKIKDTTTTNNPKLSQITATKKQLHRSNSSTLHYRPKPKPMTEYEQFYFTSTNGKSNNADEFLQIINERRKILKSESLVESTENQNSLDVKDIKDTILEGGEVKEIGEAGEGVGGGREEGNVIPSEMKAITTTAETLLPLSSHDCISRTDTNCECTSGNSTNNTTVISSTTIALIHEMPIENSEIVQKDTCHTTDEEREKEVEVDDEV
ncbi:hypothetical protein ACFFRR_009941 [Megaselia abdita]